MADKVLDERGCFEFGYPSLSVGIGRLAFSLAGIGLPSISLISTAESKTSKTIEALFALLGLGGI